MIVLIVAASVLDYWGSTAEFAHNAWVKCVESGLSMHEREKGSSRQLADTILAGCIDKRKAADAEFLKLEPSPSELEKYNEFYKKAEILLPSAIDEFKASKDAR